MAASQLRDLPLSSLMEQVLPFRSAKYIEDFTEKLLGEGIASPGDLLLASREALETKLRSHAAFNFIEMADTISLRNAVDPQRAEAPSKPQRPRPSQRSTDSRQRSRSHDHLRGAAEAGRQAAASTAGRAAGTTTTATLRARRRGSQSYGRRSRGATRSR